MRRLILAFRTFFAILFRGEAALQPAPSQPVPPPPAVVPASAGALQILAILQRDARLVDFLMEDISAYPDEQVGAAVRSLHEQCHQALERYLRLEPVIDAVEGSFTRLSPDAVNPSAVKFLGNVPAKGVPEGGLLRHRGWRAANVQLPALDARQDLSVVAPAEIEVQ